MFTGIIEELGTVKAMKKQGKSATLTIEGNKIFDGIKKGDSVSTNGVCLTVTSINDKRYTADVMKETIEKSSLGDLQVGGIVNLERAMPANGRFDGHIVSGHIDGVGKITKIKKDEIAIWYTIVAEEKILKYIVEKGSIAIDGISLTVARVTDRDFSVSIIPHTAKETNLHTKIIGSKVNLENDIVGKYIEKFAMKGRGITKEFLMENEF